MAPQLVALNSLSLKTTLISLSLLVFLNACGRDKRNSDKQGADPQATSISGDAELAQESMSSNIDDAMEALADQEANSSGAGLALAGASLSGNNSISRSCSTEGNNAKVVIQATFDNSVSNRQRGAVTMSRTNHWETERTRVWSRVDANQAPVPVTCDANDKFAAIDWHDVQGLSLDVTFKHERDFSMEMTNTRNGKSHSHSRIISATGTRHVVWASTNDASSDATTEIRNKTVSSETTRSVKVTKVNGQEASFELNVKTDASSPLAIAVERKKADLSLVSRTIKSGKLIASRTGDGRVESVFTNFKVGFASGICALQGGSIETSVYAEGATAPSKHYKIDVQDSGSYTVTDLISGESIDDFDINDCDPSDFASN